MSELLEIGSTGFAQVGQPDYYDKARFEGKFLKKKFLEMLGEPPAGCAFVWAGHLHDFGTYYELALRIPDNSQPTWQTAYKYFERCEKLDIDRLEDECRKEYEASLNLTTKEK